MGPPSGGFAAPHHGNMQPAGLPPSHASQSAGPWPLRWLPCDVRVQELDKMGTAFGCLVTAVHACMDCNCARASRHAG